ncbi:MAG: glutathione S-transferase N-terminal domain-containing protein [Planctomycetes bacterium]|nr:glutathione S-transferase N-terminal domain-containing protein [Planctomycetota bacterium]
MKTVMVYSTPTCPWCIKVKDYLKSKNVEFQNFDVSTDSARAEEMTKLTGQSGVPVIKIDSEVIIGFDQTKIDAALGS